MFKLGKKGIINFVEAIIMIIIILVSFAVLFPGINFKSRWNDALTILSARDAVITMDRLNLLYANSFNATSLQNFIDTAIPLNRSGYVAWASVDSTFKNSIVVACNCTSGQIINLAYWTNGMEINGRPINFTFFNTSLQTINPSDVLLIWNNTNLDDSSNSILNTLTNYLASGSGVVEMNDFSNTNQIGTVQKTIFGLTSISSNNYNSQASSDYFSRKPYNSTDIIYGPYKYFFHVSAPIKTYELVGPFPVKSNLQQPSCSNGIGHGTFTLNFTSYNFWICSPSTVYFDTNVSGDTGGIPSADTSLVAGTIFSLGGYNFTLQYINFPSQIGVSFGLNYQFADFLGSWTPPGNFGQGCAWGHYYQNLLTTTNNEPRYLINASFQKNNLPDVASSILNSTGGKAAWIADFSNAPNVTDQCNSRVMTGSDDDKFLLISLLLWASNKQQFPIISTSVKTGFLIPYVNVQYNDTFEIYKFNLGIGSPFGT